MRKLQGALNSSNPKQEGEVQTMIPRFANGNLTPNEELDVYPQTQEIILASLSPESRAREEAETQRLKGLIEDDAVKDT